jgi:hypothetical protein
MHLVHVDDEQPLRDILAFGFMAFDPGIKLHQFATADTCAVKYNCKSALSALELERGTVRGASQL